MGSPVFLMLSDAESAHAEITRVWRQYLKPLLLVGRRFEMEIRDERRSSAASAKLHAEIGEIAKRLEWAGKPRDTEVWKRLLTAAWLRARGDGVEILPALDGHGVDVVFRRTSSLSRAEMSELLEFILAWKAEHMPSDDPTTPHEGN